NIRADEVALDLIAIGPGQVEDDAALDVPRNKIAGARRCAANRVQRAATNHYTGGRVPQGGFARHVRAHVVAHDQVARGAASVERYTVAGVAGDHIACGSRDAPDGVIRGAHLYAVTCVTEGGRSGNVRTDEVPCQGVVCHISRATHDDSHAAVSRND